MEWFLMPFKRYAEFSGRSRRKEYWSFVLAYAVIIGIIDIFNNLILTSASDNNSTGLASISLLISCILCLFSLAVFVPMLAVGVRRLHDTGRSGWYLLIPLIPLIGSLILLYFQVQDSQPGINAYGPNPKETPAPL